MASPKKIGMHNSIPEYASTANISTTPSFHIHGVATFIPSKERLRCCFLLEYIQTSQGLSSNKEMEPKRKNEGERKKISFEKKKKR
jgi:hypothetical protein